MIHMIHHPTIGFLSGGKGVKPSPRKSIGDQGQERLHEVLLQQYHQQPLIKIQQRPHTPEQIRKKCLECDSMKDFIQGLQGELKRLQDLQNELNLQAILAGVDPQEPTEQTQNSSQ